MSATDDERNRHRLVFGSVAADYDAHRPSYPDAVVDGIVSLSGIDGGAMVLDVGAGTGKLTEPFARRGFAVTALEPDAAMAVLIGHRCRGLDVEVVVAGFESWTPTRSVALVVAGQSWHWVDPASGPARAADCLAPNGWVALLWNRPDERWAGELRDEIDAAYARHAPELGARVGCRPVVGTAEERAAAGLDASGRYGPVVWREHRWSSTYEAPAYTSLLATHSDHVLLPAGPRASLLVEISAAVGRHGGSFEHPYVTDLVAAPVLG